MRKKDHLMVKKPNAFLYFIAYILAYPFLKITFRLKVNRSCFNPPKGPFIVLANHESFIDFLLVMLAFYPYRLNAVAAQKYFNFRPLNWLLPIMGAIPKYLFETDMRAVLSIMRVIKRGDQLLIFPEGRDSVHGPYMGMIKSTGKLIKKLEVPVVSCNIEGSYNCAPFWRKGFRRGRIRVTFANLFSAEDVQRLTVDEINDRIDARLSGADAMPAQALSLDGKALSVDKLPEGKSSSADKPSEDKPSSAESPPEGKPSSSDKPLTLFKAKKLVEGLENILYYCPCCHSEFTLKTADNIISCTTCGITATMDRSSVFSAGRVGVVCREAAVSGQETGSGEGVVGKQDAGSGADAFPKTVSDWYTTQVLYEKQRLEEGVDLVRTEVLVSMPLDRGRGFAIRGQGELRLDSKGWHFDGEIAGENTQLLFPINTVPVVPFEPNYSIQICKGKDFYDFLPRDNPRASAKYATIGECAYWRFASTIQMTPGKDSAFPQ